MPNGPTHRRITAFAQFLSCFSVILLDFPVFLAVQTGITLTYYVNPDADIAQRLGAVGDFLGLEDYEEALPHRYGMYRRQWRDNWWKTLLGSHTPITGTLVRAAILLLPAMAIALILGAPWRETCIVGGSIYGGMAYSDVWHIVADKLVSDVKRAWK
ncbi:MAG: hypothetical protein A2W25_11715 [candidate division Zixibacteria bacterium RBG_16_53_22]|nr:MAG: hypothetical protein A2W25_11715 [candidate division Zixibacteria bacterium RBG_16_53_22]